MRKIISLLIIYLFFFSCQSNDLDDDISPEEFAIIAKNSTPGITESYWENPNVLVLTFEEGSLKEKRAGPPDENGNPTYSHEAAGMAYTYAGLGKDVLGTITCVKVQYTDGQQLAYECAK